MKTQKLKLVRGPPCPPWMRRRDAPLGGRTLSWGQRPGRAAEARGHSQRLLPVLRHLRAENGLYILKLLEKYPEENKIL